MYTLYTISGSCSTGIHALLNALNLPVKIVKREDIANYQELVPTNQVPALQDGELLLTEGAAIVHYLLEKHLPDAQNTASKTEFNRWLMFCYATLHSTYSKLFTTWKGMEDGPDKQGFYQLLADQLSSLWQIVDNQLAEQPYITGDRVSVMDYLIAIYANWGNNFPQLSIKLGDNVKRTIAQVAQLPEFVEAFEVEGATHSIPQNA